MKLLKLLWSFHGRIGRLAYWGGLWLNTLWRQQPSRRLSISNCIESRGEPPDLVLASILFSGWVPVLLGLVRAHGKAPSRSRHVWLALAGAHCSHLRDHGAAHSAFPTRRRLRQRVWPSAAEGLAPATTEQDLTAGRYQSEARRRWTQCQPGGRCSWPSVGTHAIGASNIVGHRTTRSGLWVTPGHRHLKP